MKATLGRAFILFLSVWLVAFLGTACSAPQGYYYAAEPQPIEASQPAPEILIPTASPVPPAILEQRLLTLEWPPAIRAGDSDRVRLTIEVDEEGNITPTAEVEGNEVRGEIVQIPDMFETHSVYAEARLDLAGMQVSPADLTSQSLLPGETVTFYWSVSPERPNTYRGTVWFYLRFVPLDGGPETQKAISAQPIEIRAVDLLGLSGSTARVVGGVGTVAGSVLGLDNIVPWVWKRLRRPKAVKSAGVER